MMMIGFFVRISPTDFFVVQPELGRIAGQAACLRYLREVLNHFLGDAAMAPSGVLQVTRITNGRLEAAHMDDSVQAHADGGGELYAWTVDDAAQIARLTALGVDGIITNDPRLFG